MMQSKKNKTLAILGGPHTNGTTAKMLDIAVNSCKARGDEVSYLNLYEKNILFCRGCRKCLDTQVCVMQGDDMADITKQIKESDTIILAAPVYWANVPAAAKNLFDRLLGAAMEETKTFPKPRLSGKKYVLLTACNTQMPFAKIFGQSTGAIRAMKEVFRTAGMKCIGVAVCGNTSKRKEVPKKIRKKIEHFFA
ncbi:MAG: flavodoxin family protein [Roseburia sp.]